jgi:hypothetical protein
MKMRSMARALYAAAVLCALGAGATQALAAPQVDAAARRACLNYPCKRDCMSVGYFSGHCVEGYCECYDP